MNLEFDDYEICVMIQWWKTTEPESVNQIHVVVCNPWLCKEFYCDNRKILRKTHLYCWHVSWTEVWCCNDENQEITSNEVIRWKWKWFDADQVIETTKKRKLKNSTVRKGRGNEIVFVKYEKDRPMNLEFDDYEICVMIQW